jgi:hypothetical protein
MPNPDLLADLRAAADAGRQAADDVGIRTVTVTFVLETWSLPFGTLGATLVGSPVTLAIVPNPKVVQSGEGEASYFGGDGGESASTGVLRASRYTIGPITRTYASGGYRLIDLLTVPTNTTQRRYIKLDDGGDNFLAGGEKFLEIAVDGSRPLHIMIDVARSDQT